MASWDIRGGLRGHTGRWKGNDLGKCFWTLCKFKHECSTCAGHTQAWCIQKGPPLGKTGQETPGGQRCSFLGSCAWVLCLAAIYTKKANALYLADGFSLGLCIPYTEEWKRTWSKHLKSIQGLEVIVYNKLSKEIDLVMIPGPHSTPSNLT